MFKPVPMIAHILSIYPLVVSSTVVKYLTPKNPLLSNFSLFFRFSNNLKMDASALRLKPRRNVLEL